MNHEEHEDTVGAVPVCPPSAPEYLSDEHLEQLKTTTLGQAPIVAELIEEVLRRREQGFVLGTIDVPPHLIEEVLRFRGELKVPSPCIGSTIRTWTGRYFDVANPRAEDICIDDIAHALSLICRYNGHIDEFYSVAQHSILVASILPRELQLCGLLHDASEAYFADVVRPAKRLLREYKTLENGVLRAVAERFNLPRLMPAEVHRADNIVLVTEMVRFGYPNDFVERVCVECGVGPDNELNVTPWTSGFVEARFLAKFNSLCDV